MKNFKIISITFCLMTMIGLTFQSCEKDQISTNTHEENEYLTIEGKIDDSYPLTEISSIITLNRASARVFKNAKLQNGKIFISTSSGEELNMSDELYKYSIDNVNKINIEIAEGKIKPHVDKEGNICLRRKKTNGLWGIARLKSGQESGSNNKYNPSAHSNNENINWINKIFNSSPDGYLSEYMNVSDTNWNLNGMGFYTISGYGTIEGKQARYNILNACGGFVDNVNCEANYLGRTEIRNYSDGAVAEERIIYNTRRDPILSIIIYRNKY